MGDLPLRTPTDRCPGGPLPRRQANQTHPHPIAENLCFTSDAVCEEHRALIRLSPGCTLLWARLDTRYSPVRRSPSSVASNRHAAPRLACVKPVASVHPEPGSNSTLYMYFLLFLYLSQNALSGSLFEVDGLDFRLPMSLPSINSRDTLLVLLLLCFM